MKPFNTKKVLSLLLAQWFCVTILAAETKYFNHRVSCSGKQSLLTESKSISVLIKPLREELGARSSGHVSAGKMDALPNIYGGDFVQSVDKEKKHLIVIPKGQGEWNVETERWKLKTHFSKLKLTVFGLGVDEAGKPTEKEHLSLLELEVKPTDEKAKPNERISIDLKCKVKSSS